MATSNSTKKNPVALSGSSTSGGGSASAMDHYQISISEIQKVIEPVAKKVAA